MTARARKTKPANIIAAGRASEHGAAALALPDIGADRKGAPIDLMLTISTARRSLTVSSMPTAIPAGKVILAAPLGLVGSISRVAPAASMPNTVNRASTASMTAPRKAPVRVAPSPDLPEATLGAACTPLPRTTASRAP
jgi:hypothetical protein